MPTVVLDFERLKHPHCGLGQFCLHLGQALVSEGAGRIEPVFFLPYGAELGFAGEGYRRIYARPWKKEACYRWLRPCLRPFLRRPAIDLWHTANQLSKYGPLDPRIPVVLTIHDLNFLRGSSPNRIRRKLRSLQAKVDRAAALTTGSQFVAGELREHLDLRGKALHVIYDGVSQGIRHDKQRPAFAPDGPFLFAIGNLLPHKNFHVLLDFMQLVPEYHLIIAGPKATPYGATLARRIAEQGLTDRVLLPGAISDAHRQWLYEECEALLFPSLAEGFGLPVLEAMQCGRPVFMSRLTSLPEVGGPWGCYWDSFEAEAMVQVFREGLARFHAEAGYSKKLRDHAARFSWTNTARGYLEAYEQVLKNA